MPMSRGVMTCEEAIQRLFTYLDGELAGAEQEDLETHLRRCRDCFTRAEFERWLRARLAETGSAPTPATLRERVRRLIARL